MLGGDLYLNGQIKYLNYINFLALFLMGSALVGLVYSRIRNSIICFCHSIRKYILALEIKPI